MVVAQSSVTVCSQGSYHVRSWLGEDRVTEVTQVYWHDKRVIADCQFGDHGRYSLMVVRSTIGFQYLVFDGAVLETNPKWIEKYGRVAKLIAVELWWQDIVNVIAGLDEVTGSVFQPNAKRALSGDVVVKFNTLWQVLPENPECDTDIERMQYASAKRLSEGTDRVICQRVQTAGTTEPLIMAIAQDDMIIIKEDITYDDCGWD